MLRMLLTVMSETPHALAAGLSLQLGGTDPCSDLSAAGRCVHGGTRLASPQRGFLQADSDGAQCRCSLNPRTIRLGLGVLLSLQWNSAFLHLLLELLGDFSLYPAAASVVHERRYLDGPLNECFSLLLLDVQTPVPLPCPGPPLLLLCTAGGRDAAGAVDVSMHARVLWHSSCKRPPGGTPCCTAEVLLGAGWG